MPDRLHAVDLIRRYRPAEDALGTGSGPSTCESRRTTASAWRTERDGVAGTNATGWRWRTGSRTAEPSGRSATGWRTRTAPRSSPMPAWRDWDRDELPIRVTLAVTEGAGPVFDRTWELPVPRDLLW